MIRSDDSTEPARARKKKESGRGTTERPLLSVTYYSKEQQLARVELSTVLYARVGQWVYTATTGSSDDE